MPSWGVFTSSGENQLNLQSTRVNSRQLASTHQKAVHSHQKLGLLMTGPRVPYRPDLALPPARSQTLSHRTIAPSPFRL